mgnify:CR=1 FL=1
MGVLGTTSEEEQDVGGPSVLHAIVEPVRAPGGPPEDLCFTAVSPELAAAVGQDATALIGQRMDDVLIAPGVAAVRSAAQTCAASGTPVLLEAVDLPVAPGLVAESDVTVTGADGAVVLTWHDVSAALRTRRRYRLLDAYGTDVVSLASQDGVFEWVSESVQARYGWHPSDLVGRPAIDLAHPDDRAQVRQASARIDAGEFVCLRVRIRGKDGQYRWTATTLQRITDPETGRRLRIASWRDVDDEVAAEEALATSEAHFRLLAENATDIVIETDPALAIAWVSPSVRHALGWEPTSLIGVPALELVVEDDRQKVIEARPEVLEQGRPSTLELRLRTASGGFRWVRAYGRAVDAPDGTILVVGVVDIDEYVAERKARANSEARYRLLVESAADVVLAISDDGQITWASPSVTAALGWYPEELMGVDPLSLMPDDDRPGYCETLRTLFEQQLTTPVELTVRSSDGSWRQMLAVFHLIDVAFDGEASVVIGLTDITELASERSARVEADAHFRLLAEHGSTVVYQCALDGTVTWISPTLESLAGWQPTGVVGHPLTDLLDPDDVTSAALAHSRLVATGQPTSFEARLLDLDGGSFWVEISVEPLVDAVGSTSGWVGEVRDIDDAVRNRQALEQSERQFRLAMEASPVGMAVVDLDRRLVSVNSAFAGITGRSPEWLLGHRLPDVLDPADDVRELRMHALALADDHTPEPIEVRVLRPDGDDVWVEHSVGVLRDERGMPVSYISTITDISEAVRDRSSLAYQASHDPLTRLVNRRELLRLADGFLSRRRRGTEHVAALYIDVDDLKDLNDAYGHRIGDEALVAVADRIDAACRAGDVVARVGGDEFVVLLTGIRATADAEAVASKILAHSTVPVVCDGDELVVGLSIGLALAEPDEGLDSLLWRADQALYRAKAGGRGQRATYDPALDGAPPGP